MSISRSYKLAGRGYEGGGLTVIVHLGPIVFIILPPKKPVTAKTAYIEV